MEEQQAMQETTHALTDEPRAQGGQWAPIRPAEQVTGGNREEGDGQDAAGGV